jgi:hypothetical protein
MPFEKFDLESLDKERRKAVAKSIRTISVEELKKLGGELFRYAMTRGGRRSSDLSLTTLARRSAALAPAAVPLPVAGPEFMLTGVGDADLFGLNKRGNLNLRGVGDGTGVGLGVEDASAVAFLRVRLDFGEAAGDSASEADVVLSAREAVWVVLCVGCFGGVGDSVGVPVSNCD